MSSRLSARAVGLVLFLLPVSFVLAQERYDTTELKPLSGYQGTVVRAVATDGRAVGSSVRVRGEVTETEATAWDVKGQPRHLRWAGAKDTTDYQTEAIDINEQGAILGIGRRPDASEVVLFWSDDEKRPHWLEVHGTVHHAGVNDEGIVFGDVHDKELGRDLVYMIRFEEHFEGCTIPLPGVPADGSAHALGITTEGTVIGSLEAPNGTTHAVAWVPDPESDEYALRYSMQFLSSQGETSVASAAGPEEDHGEGAITGHVSVGDRLHAASWQANHLEDLGVPDGFDESEAFGIDRDGYVACIARAHDETGEVTSDALWLTRPERGDSFLISTAPLVRLGSAAMAPDGRIVLNGKTDDGMTRAVLLTPPGLN